MSKQREAVKIALQALEEIAAHYPADWEFELTTQAIQAIREALAEPEPNPVMWIMVNGEHGHKPTLHWKPQEDWHITWKAVPLYAAPHARKPLTDDEIENCLPMGIAAYTTVCGKTEIIKFARAIEKAHGIAES